MKQHLIKLRTTHHLLFPIANYCLIVSGGKSWPDWPEYCLTCQRPSAKVPDPTSWLGQFIFALARRFAWLWNFNYYWFRQFTHGCSLREILVIFSGRLRFFSAQLRSGITHKRRNSTRRWSTRICDRPVYLTVVRVLSYALIAVEFSINQFRPDVWTNGRLMRMRLIRFDSSPTSALNQSRSGHRISDVFLMLEANVFSSHD